MQEFCDYRINIEPRKGYASAQDDLDYINTLLGGMDPYFSARIRQEQNIQEEELNKFLTWIKYNFKPRFVYYPFSGWHITPKEVFGEGHVLHLSNERCHNHLKDIGDGLKIKADAQNPPFKNNVYDATFLRGVPFSTKQQKEEFFTDLRKIIKDDGIVIIDNTDKNPILKLCQKTLVPVEIPDHLKPVTAKKYFLFKNEDILRKKRFSFLKRK